MERVTPAADEEAPAADEAPVDEPPVDEAPADIRLEVYVLDPALLVPGGAAVPDVQVPIADRVGLRLLDVRRYRAGGGPHVMSFALDFAREMTPAALAAALWDFLRARRGGRGVVTARVMRRREERGLDEASGQPVVERHELWMAIPLRSSKNARRRIGAFFEEVLAPT